jgi:hypothetical protein
MLNGAPHLTKHLIESFSHRLSPLFVLYSSRFGPMGCYFSYFQGEIDYGFSSALWNPIGLNDGTYELIVHVACEPSGLHFPPPGIDESYSSIVTGVCFWKPLRMHTLITLGFLDDFARCSSHYWRV